MPNVLVVDDTPSIRFLIRTNLELAGFDVEEAVDGQDCLDTLRSLDVLPDLVTVDVMMPRLDGVSTVSAIRADPRLAAIKVVMVSTQAQSADIKRGEAAGVDSYVTKPFDPDHLIEVLHEVLARD